MAVLIVLLPVGAATVHAHHSVRGKALGRRADWGGEQRRGEGRNAPGEVLPELGCEEVVKQGVEAAAQVRQAQGDGVELAYSYFCCTVRHNALRHHQVEQKVEMVGYKTDQEEDEAAQHHQQRTLLLSICLLFGALFQLTVRGDRLKSTACCRVEHV